ncbi:hypothetical protein [Chitinolyticbacter meiyuanensis]|uniref:hypothetical protein n=1 Tax=Chitinolyticbacter meiyuanensis TaxID=682798 RepID=UPI0011E5BE73|nr:hypothetical protein [Chitinolyticbacter meiyuanensis]
MKKFFALVVLSMGMMAGAQAAEVRAYQISNSSPSFDGQAYCSSVWAGSQFFGFRQGNASYHFILCRKD